MNRRTFLARTAQGAAGALCLSRTGSLSSVLSPKKLTSIGAQLYTVRRELEKDFEGTLARVAALGYREVEFAGYFGHKPEEVRQLLARHGLAAPSAHFDLAAWRGDLQPLIDAAHAVGHEYLLLAWTPPEVRKTLDDYRRLAELCDRAGERLGRAGLQFAYHNHDFEFARIGGRAPYDLLLEQTDPKLVKLELDLYWLVKGGGEPFEYFERWPGRFPLLHVKDMDATPKRYFTEVGRGVIDFKSIFARAGRAGVRHYFVEQDETPGSPFDSLRASIDYLKRLEF